MVHGNYNIEVRVTNTDKDELVGMRSSQSREIVEQIVGADVDKWIERYDRENYKQCFKCFGFYHKDDLTTVPEDTDDEEQEKLVCHPCLSKLMNGETQLE